MNTLSNIFGKIPIFWINLFDSNERHEHMISQFNDYKYNFKIEAIDGRNSKKFANYNIKCINIRNFTTAMIAVVCSHIKAIKYGYDRGYDIICVVEDDANFELIKYYPYTINDIIKKTPKEWEIIQLYYTEKMVNILDDYKKNGLKVFKRDYIYSGTAYLINRQGMRKILKTVADTDGLSFFDIKIPIISPEEVIFSHLNSYVLNLPFLYYYNEKMTFEKYVDDENDIKNVCQNIQFKTKELMINFYKSNNIQYLGEQIPTQTMKIFQNIYEQNIWFNLETQNLMQTESKSGGGSTLKQTEIIRKELPLLFNRLNIKSILDAPCGDFNWMKYINFDNIQYIGIDIVPVLIESNIKKYQNKNISFLNLDIISSRLPTCDLILCRDCLVHLPIENIFQALQNMKRSGSTYLLTTSFSNDRKNRLDMIMGDWQPLNLLASPFNFPQPLEIINENCTEGDGLYKDKSLMLWKLEDLKFDMGIASTHT